MLTLSHALQTGRMVLSPEAATLLCQQLRAVSAEATDLASSCAHVLASCSSSQHSPADVATIWRSLLENVTGALAMSDSLRAFVTFCRIDDSNMFCDALPLNLLVAKLPDGSPAVLELVASAQRLTSLPGSFETSSRTTHAVAESETCVDAACLSISALKAQRCAASGAGGASPDGVLDLWKRVHAACATPLPVIRLPSLFKKAGVSSEGIEVQAGVGAQAVVSRIGGLEVHEGKDCVQQVVQEVMHTLTRLLGNGGQGLDAAGIREVQVAVVRLQSLLQGRGAS
jgi:hypothetical protein